MMQLCFLLTPLSCPHSDDIKADDLIGLLKPQGQPIRYFEVERSPGGMMISANKCGVMTRNDAVYELTWIYCHHKGTSGYAHFGAVLW